MKEIYELLRAHRDGHSAVCKKLKVAITYIPTNCIKTHLGWYRVITVTETMLCCESMEFDSILWVPNPLTAPHKIDGECKDLAACITLQDTVSHTDTFQLDFQIY